MIVAAARATDQDATGSDVVKIDGYRTCFWRTQRESEMHLATIEAIYYFYREFAIQHEARCAKESYQGEYDDLLFFYKFFYELISADHVELKRTGKRKAESQHRDRDQVEVLPDSAFPA
jgi:hypothetical protein